MIEIKGLYNTAVCYTPALEPAAEQRGTDRLAIIANFTTE